MAEIPLDYDAIGGLARAILAQLSPLTGTRGTGTVTVTNPTGADIVLPANTYMVPVVQGELTDDRLFKVAPDPAQVDVWGRNGDWTIPGGGDAQVAVKSNLGGKRHCLPAGTVFRFDPPLDGLDLTCTLDADITDGADGDFAAFVARANYYEDLESGSVAKDLHAGRLSQLPALMLVWQSSTPIEGRTAGTNQGSTRLEDGKRMFRESFRLFVVVGSMASDTKRRTSGLVILQAVTRLLTDQQVNRDFEVLTSLGSLEITSRTRFARDERVYIYSLELRVNRLLKRVDERQFFPWLRTHLVMALPGHEAPEPTAPLTMVDVDDPMPPGT